MFRSGHDELNKLNGLLASVFVAEFAEYCNPNAEAMGLQILFSPKIFFRLKLQ